MSSEYVDPGFVDAGYIESIPIASSSHRHWTDFREYRRGRLPDDWTERVNTGSESRIEGAFIDLNHRNYLRLHASESGPTILTWDAPDTDENAENQEGLALIRIVNRSADPVPVVIVRAADSALTHYTARINIATGALSLDKCINGVYTSLDSAIVSYKLGGFYRILLSAQETTISLRAWEYGEAEPGVWSLSAVDSSISSGKVGVRVDNSNDNIEIHSFSVGTDGESAPREDEFDEPLDIWISEPDELIEITARFEYYNPDTDSVESVWRSNYPRTTTLTDYPSNTRMANLLIDPGTLTYRLESDAHLGGAAIPSRTPIRLHNLPIYPSGPGPHDTWLDYSFYGRPVEIRIGKFWHTKPTIDLSEGIRTEHRRFEIVGCCNPEREPEVGLEEVTVPLDSSDSSGRSISTPESLLRQRLPTYHNIGIPTGVKSLTTSGYLVIPDNSAYLLTSFKVMFRVLIPAAGVAGSGTAVLSSHEVDATHRQWFIGLRQASHATNPHSIAIQSFRSDGTAIIAHTSSAKYNLNRYIDVIFAVKNMSRWYLIIDQQKIAEGVIVDSPTTAAGSSVIVLNNAVGLSIVDHRIEQYTDEDESLARFSARREPDSLIVSMHRMDDNTGATVTDYSSLANHGTLQGVNNTDREWTPTYLGNPELAGTSMPISGGIIFNAPTQTIDTVRNVVRYNDRARTAATDLLIRSRGALLVGGGTDYSESSEGPGTADMIDPTDDPITYGIEPTSADTIHMHAAQIACDELINRDALSFSTCDCDSFSGVRQLLPMQAGFHYSEPPAIGDFISYFLGSLGAYFGIDQHARIIAGCMTPTVNPGPYGQESLLEFLGLPNQGATFSANPAFNLNDTLVSGRPWFGVAAWIKLPLNWKDPSATMGTYFPSGMTIIDRVDEASGYYLGIDGRDGSIIFGAPGVTGVSSGLHYLSYPYHLEANKPYFIFGYQDFDTRIIGVYSMEDPTLALQGEASESTTGAMTVASNAPLRIGHGPRGSFYGWIGYALGSSSALGQSDFVDIVGIDQFNIRTSRWSQSSVNADRWTRTRFFIPLTEGRGDVAYDLKSGAVGRVHGVRWCPRLNLDFRKLAHASLPSSRRPVPAWKSEARYATNYEPLTGSNVAAGVSASDKLALGQAYLSEPDSDLRMKSNYLNSIDLPLSTPLLKQEDADKIGQMLRSRIGPDKRFADARDLYRHALKLFLTDEIFTQDDRLLPDGRAMRISTLIANLLEQKVDAGLWG